MRTKQLLRGLLLAGTLALTSLQASASHFRFGLVTATRTSETSTTATYRIDVSESWRDGTASVSSPFSISGGNTGSFSVTMTIVNDPIGNWDNSTGSAVITLNKTSTPTRIEYTNCCKISTILNNNDQNWDEYIILNTNAAGSSPVSSLPAIVNIPVGAAAASFAIPATDPDAGSTLTWGSPNLVSGPLAGQSQPPTFSVNSSTGMATMNTTGLTIGDQYNAMTTVTDNNGNQIFLDYLIEIVGPSNPPYFNYAVTPANNAVFNVSVGTPLSFNINALDSDLNSTVGLSVSGLNAFITAANFSPALPNTNPGGTQVGFSYTATSVEAGSSYVLNFIATDNMGVQSFSSVTINVSACSTYGTTITSSLGMGIDNCNTNTIYLGYGPQSATLTATPNGGTAPYTYLWSNSATTSSISVSPLTATSYSVAVMDANGCPSTASNTLQVKVMNVRCSAGNSNNNDKVKVWHKTGNNGHNAICISANGVAAHLAHGDCLGDGTNAFLRMSSPNTVINADGNGISIFPNPASGKVNIVLNDVGSAYQWYQVTDISGRVLSSHNLPAEIYSDVIHLDLSGFAKGIYMVRAVTGEGASVAKFIVE